MAQGFETVLTASDETAAAFTSAQNRQQKYARAVSGSDRELAKMRISMAQAGAASQALTGVLGGNVAALDNVGTAMAAISPKFLKAGAALAAFGVGWQIGTMIRQLDIVDKTLEKIGLKSIRDPTADTAAAIERTAGMISRKRMAQGAEQEVTAADIAARTDKSGEARAIATEQAARDRAQEEQRLAVAEARNATAKAQLGVVQAVQKGGSVPSIADAQEIDKARAALEEAKANEVAIAEAGARKIEAAQMRVNQAIKAGSKEAQILGEKLADAAAGEALDRAQQYKTTIDEAVANLSNPSARKEALALAAGNPMLRGQEREALLNKVAQNAEIDKLGELERQRRDPAAREQARELERARKHTDRAIKSAERAVEEGRPLTKAQKQLLENKRVLDEQFARGKNLRNAELDAKDRREAQQARDIQNLLTEQQQINRELKTLLVAAN